MLIYLLFSLLIILLHYLEAAGMDNTILSICNCYSVHLMGSLISEMHVTDTAVGNGSRSAQWLKVAIK